MVNSVPQVAGQIGAEAQRVLDRLASQLSARRSRNQIRSDYYDMHNLFRSMGIAIPPNLRNLEVAMGWPAKAVDMLAMRVRLSGFALPGADLGDWGIHELIRETALISQSRQATVSALIHGVAWIMVSGGPDDVEISTHTANDATGIFGKHGRLEWALVRDGVDDSGETTGWILCSTDMITSLHRTRTGWTVDQIPHNLGRVPVEPLVYRPRLGRPFGSARITREVMSLTDSAMRTVARSEVGAEFFSAPQRYLLGADEEKFVGADGERKTVWDLVMGRILTYPDADDGTGNKLQIGQFPQVSMQPHSDQLRMLAGQFCGATYLPMSSLGITQDGGQASSAEAIFAAKEDLIIEAEATAEGFSDAWCHTLTTAVQVRDGLKTRPGELGGLAARWRDPSTPSRAQATDAVMKQISAGILPADSDVALEQLGYDAVTIARVKEHRENAAPTGLEALAAALGEG